MIGNDDVPLGGAITPALTTLAPDFTAFAVALASVVDGILHGNATEQALPISFHRLVLRDSS